MASFGKRIATLRDAKGWSQTDLGNFMGISKGAVAHWEHDRRMPRCQDLRKLAKVLGVTVGHLYGERQAA